MNNLDALSTGFMEAFRRVFVRRLVLKIYRIKPSPKLLVIFVFLAIFQKVFIGKTKINK